MRSGGDPDRAGELLARDLAGHELLQAREEDARHLDGHPDGARQRDERIAARGRAPTRPGRIAFSPGCRSGRRSSAPPATSVSVRRGATRQRAGLPVARHLDRRACGPCSRAPSPRRSTKLPIGSPSTATIRSPGTRPACAAGMPGVDARRPARSPGSRRARRGCRGPAPSSSSVSRCVLRPAALDAQRDAPRRAGGLRRRCAKPFQSSTLAGRRRPSRGRPSAAPRARRATPRRGRRAPPSGAACWRPSQPTSLGCRGTRRAPGARRRRARRAASQRRGAGRRARARARRCPAGRSRTASSTSSHQRTGSPSTATMRSPGSRPARGGGRAALDGADDGRRRGRCPPIERARRSRPPGAAGSSPGPANDDRELLPERLRAQRLLVEAGSTPSRAPRCGRPPRPRCLAEHLTKPPSGNHAITYSVPLRCQARRKRPKPIGGPKPIENLSTRTPQQLAPPGSGRARAR